VARDATARLYDVDANSVVLDKKAATITFQAKKGRVVDLDKLHESIWGTRLGDGTGMELKRLDITAVGEVVLAGQDVLLKVPGVDQHFLLADDAKAAALGRLREAAQKGEKMVRVTGRVEGWSGNLTKLTSQLPAKPRRIIVSEFQPVK
jgi:hypothetical protein